VLALTFAILCTFHNSVHVIKVNDYPRQRVMISAKLALIVWMETDCVSYLIDVIGKMHNGIMEFAA